MQIQSSIKMKRNRKRIDSSRYYEILLDSEHAGIIFEDRSISIPVEPGQHSLRVRLDYLDSSSEINFDINPGEEIRFECENNLSSSLESLLYIYFRIGNRISIKRYD